MTRKSEIIDFIVSELKQITPNVFRHFKYLDEINDFPTITLMIGIENRTHIGAGVKYANVEFNIRAYVRGPNELAIEEADDMIEKIDAVISQINNPIIQDIRILQASTDEGLFGEFGIVDIIAEVFYESPQM